MSNLRAYILCRFADRSAIYTPWLDRLSLEYEIVQDDVSTWSVPDDAGIVITHMHYRWEEISVLRKLTETNRVPVLILADGILEYRNTWEHPDIPDGCIFQPLCGHKLACIGRGQARVVEAWGNLGRCEVVGMPRLDLFTAQPVPPVKTDGPFRLLVATANTPAFTPQQRQTIAKSLRFLVERFERNPDVNGRPVELTWRLTDGLSIELGLPELPLEERPQLQEAIDQSDAVITSPSTLYLESIARGRPTAVLDYWNSPTYIAPAWSIAANAHVNRVLEQLADPPPHRMMFQQSVLDEQLECQSAATPRLIRLIDTMVDEGRAARAEHRSIELPARILPATRRGFPHIPENFDLASLYPDNRAFSQREVDSLRLELAAAIKRLDQVPEELADNENYIKQLHTWLANAKTREESLTTRLHEMHQRTKKMREHYGLGQTSPADQSGSSKRPTAQSDSQSSEES